MLNLEFLSVNSSGHLAIEGCDATDIASEFGTPLYVMSEPAIRNSCRKYTEAIKKYYNNFGLALFASKSFCCMEMCRIIDEENMGLDVASGGELYTAVKAKFPAKKIYFHGNNKTYDELKFALEYDIKRVVVDNSEELNILNDLTLTQNKICNVLLRVKPGIDAHTHDYIKTGKIDSKFGILPEEAIEIIKNFKKYKNINFKGLHCHIGSQILEIEPFKQAAAVMMDLIFKIKSKTGLEVKELNLGGGFGIRYTPDDTKLDYDMCIKEIAEVIKAKAQKFDLNLPYILFEPGRSITGEAGITLYKVGNTKIIPTIKKYVAIDGSMADNPRFILYKAKYSVINATKANVAPNELITLAGKCCESGDIIGENLLIANPNVGDIIAVLSTGAYNYSMSSNYNKMLKPAVLLVNKNTSKIIVKRQTYADITSQDF